MIVDLRKFSTTVDAVGDVILVGGQVLQDHVPTALFVTSGQHLNLTGHNFYRIGIIVTVRLDCIKKSFHRLLDLATSGVVGPVERIHAGIDIRIHVLIHSCRC